MLSMQNDDKIVNFTISPTFYYEKFHRKEGKKLLFHLTILFDLKFYLSKSHKQSNKQQQLFYFILFAIFLFYKHLSVTKMTRVTNRMAE